MHKTSVDFKNVGTRLVLARTYGLMFARERCLFREENSFHVHDRVHILERQYCVHLQFILQRKITFKLMSAFSIHQNRDPDGKYSIDLDSSEDEQNVKDM